MGKLNLQEFKDEYRVMGSRATTGVANCKNCCMGGEKCTHPDRRRPANLSVAIGFGIDGRQNFAGTRVCRAVHVEMPEHIAVPELPRFHAVHTWSKSRIDLFHGNPRCPYVAAILVEDEKRTDYIGEGVSIRDLTDHSRVPGCLCEIPQCREMLGIPPGQPDHHLRRHGYDDGYVPYPSTLPPTILDDDDPLRDFLEGELLLDLSQRGGMNILLGEDQIDDMVRRVKLVVKNNPNLHWATTMALLRGLGLGSVTDRLWFDWRVRVLKEVYCRTCILENGSFYPEIIRNEDRPYCQKHNRPLVSRMDIGELPE